MLHGLVAHCMNSARAALVLIDQNMATEAAPLARIALEHAATVQWIIANPAGLDEFVSHVSLKNGKFYELVKGMPLDVPADIRDYYEKAVKPKSSKTLKEIRKMFRELDPNEWLYLQYLYLCGLVHPSAATTIRYLDTRGEPPGLVLHYRHDPQPILLTLAISVSTAMAAYVDLIKGKPYKKKMTDISKRMAVPQWLTADGKPPRNRL